MPILYCSICGVSIESPFALAAQTWLSETRFVVQDDLRHSAPECMSPDTPFLSQRAIIGDDEYSEPFFRNEATGSYQKGRINIFRRTRRGRVRPTSYPVHEACWNVLRVMIDEPTLQLRDKMSILHRILDSALSVDANLKLAWPHKYYGISEYQGYCRELPCEFKYAGRDPWDIYESLIYEDGFSTSYPAESTPVPFNLPLPVELVEIIYSYLDWRDIATIQKISSMQLKLVLPKRYWENLTKPFGDFGYFFLNRYLGDFQSYTPFQKFCLAKNVDLDDCTNMKNRHRVWRICKSLADQILDSAQGETFGLKVSRSNKSFLENAESSKKTRIFFGGAGAFQDYYFRGRVVTGPRIIYEGKTHMSATDGIILSYTGSGSLAFLSGITLLPSQENLGYITKNTRLVSLRDKTVLSLAFTIHGILDLYFLESIDYHYRELEHGKFNKADVAFKHKLLTASVSSTRDIKISGRWDACKMTNICIEMPDIVTFEEHDDTELFVQDHSWSPHIPPSTLNFNQRQYLELLNIFSKAPDSFSDEIFLTSERAVSRMPSKHLPLQHVILPKTPISLITGWVTRYGTGICGLSFSFKDTNVNPLVLGEISETCVDFPINGEAGEYISSVAILGTSDHGIYGIMVKTSANRTGIFATAYAKQPLESVCLQSIVVPADGRVEGFYGTFQVGKFFSHITSIGVMTSNGSECNIDHSELSSLPPIDRSFESAVYVPFNLHRKGKKSRNHFKSRASLLGCVEITCFVKIDDERVSGLRINYRPGMSTGDNFRVLGQISCGEAYSQVLKLDENESVTTIRVFYQPFYGATLAVAGLEFQTSTGKTVFWGDKTQEDRTFHEDNLISVDESVLLKLGTNSVLRWEYGHVFDNIVVEENEASINI